VWHGDDRGASSVEYALLIGAIAAVIVAVVFTLGRLTHSNISTVCTAWNTAEGNHGC
jgi:Flp pilus assembly pilin Flp